MAYKGYLRDKEHENDTIHTLLQGMRGIIMAQGAKPSKIPKPKKLIRSPDYDKLPSLSEVLNAFGGAGVVVVDKVE